MFLTHHPWLRTSAVFALALLAVNTTPPAAQAMTIEVHGVPRGSTPDATTYSSPDADVSYIGKVQVVTSRSSALPEGMKAAVQRDLGMSADQYLKDSAVSAAAARISKVLNQQFPDQITGAWSERGRIKIATTSDAAAMAVRALGLDVVPAKYSAKQLNTFAEALFDAAGATVTSVAVDPRKAGLVVGLARWASVPQGVLPADLPMSVTSQNGEQSYSDDAPDWSGSPAVRGGRGLLISPDVAGLNKDPNTWRPFAQRPQPGDPPSVQTQWNAAVKFFNQDVLPKLDQQSFIACSIGFGLRGDGSIAGDRSDYLSTAGHCYAPTQGKSDTWLNLDSDTASLDTRASRYVHQNEAGVVDPGSFGTYLGSAKYYQMGGGSRADGTPTAGDASIGNWPGSPQIDAALIPLSPLTALRASNQVYTYPTTRAGNPTENVTVTGAGDPSVGDSVCHSGVTSGWQCGQVTAVNARVRTQGSNSGVIQGFQAAMCGALGDSGGATLMGTTAVGMLQGGNDVKAFRPGSTDCAPATRHIATMTDMSTLLPAWAGVGVNLLQQVAPPLIVSPQGTVAANNLTVSGNAVAGDYVEVRVDGQIKGTVRSSATTGAWALAGIPISPGQHTVAARSKRDNTNYSAVVSSQFRSTAVKLVVYKTPTSDALFQLTGSGAGTRAVQVSFAQWQAAGFPAPVHFPSAYVKYIWSDDIYAVNFWSTDPATWSWQRLNSSEWLRAGAPRPSLAGWIAGTDLYKYSTSDELFASLQGRVHKLTLAQWQAMNFRGFAVREDQGFAKGPTGDTVYKMTSLRANRGAAVNFAQWAAEDFPTPAVRGVVPR